MQEFGIGFIVNKQIRSSVTREFVSNEENRYEDNIVHLGGKKERKTNYFKLISKTNEFIHIQTHTFLIELTTFTHSFIKTQLINFL